VYARFGVVSKKKVVDPNPDDRLLLRSRLACACDDLQNGRGRGRCYPPSTSSKFSTACHTSLSSLSLSNRRRPQLPYRLDALHTLLLFIFINFAFWLCPTGLGSLGWVCTYDAALSTHSVSVDRCNGMSNPSRIYPISTNLVLGFGPAILRGGGGRDIREIDYSEKKEENLLLPAPAAEPASLGGQQGDWGPCTIRRSWWFGRRGAEKLPAENAESGGSRCCPHLSPHPMSPWSTLFHRLVPDLEGQSVPAPEFHIRPALPFCFPRC